MAHYKDCLVNLSQVKDADIICYFSTFKRKSDIIKSIELMIGCVKLGMPVPKSYKLNDNYRSFTLPGQIEYTFSEDLYKQFKKEINTVK